MMLITVSEDFLDKFIDSKAYPDLAISLVASARGRCCLLIEGTFEKELQCVSLNGPFVTIHFTDHSYYILDNDAPEIALKLEEAGNDFFVVRTFNGLPIEGFQTKCLISSWPP